MEDTKASTKNHRATRLAVWRKNRDLPSEAASRYGDQRREDQRRRRMRLAAASLEFCVRNYGAWCPLTFRLYVALYVLREYKHVDRQWRQRQYRVEGYRTRAELRHVSLTRIVKLLDRNDETFLCAVSGLAMEKLRQELSRYRRS